MSQATRPEWKWKVTYYLEDRKRTMTLRYDAFATLHTVRQEMERRIGIDYWDTVSAEHILEKTK